MKKAIWLAYDLDIINGDFEGFYTLLDKLDAKECGECLAFFQLEVNNEEDIEKTVKELILSNVKVTENDRFYIIFSRFEDGIKKIKGKFLFGKRKKTPPWKGYAKVEVESEEEG
ncbi:MAG: hypothetical protein DSY35_04200 [Desulfurobacterium sp.]|nr:MAG: hypothetical protein DSY35_04200 [Desulfurobacterium sp.]